MSERKRREKGADISVWAWVVAAVGVVLVAGSMGFMIYQAVTGESSPPAITIETESVMQSGDGYTVPIRVRNRGGSAAAALVVEGVLIEGAGTVETSSITIAFVPAGSERRAGLIFSKDPGKFVVRVRAVGYEQP